MNLFYIFYSTFYNDWFLRLAQLELEWNSIGSLVLISSSGLNLLSVGPTWSSLSSGEYEPKESRLYERRGSVSRGRGPSFLPISVSPCGPCPPLAHTRPRWLPDNIALGHEPDISSQNIRWNPQDEILLESLSGRGIRKNPQIMLSSTTRSNWFYLVLLQLTI